MFLLPNLRLHLLCCYILLLSCFMMINNDTVDALRFCKVNEQGSEACLPAVKGSDALLPTLQCRAYVQIADRSSLCLYQRSYTLTWLDYILIGVNVTQVKKLLAKCCIKGIHFLLLYKLHKILFGP